MKVLVIGSGGREHALVHKLKDSTKVNSIWCYPGNAGISSIAQIPNIADPSPSSLAEFADSMGIDLTVVGPEGYLAEGIVDAFQERGLVIFGPSKAAAQLESSKAFAKNLMAKYGIPTAAHRVFSDFASAKAYIENAGAPIVIKADGLAAGKGVVVANSTAEALAAAEAALTGALVGEAGRRIVVEEFLSGEEVSILALCNGTNCLLLTPSQDHKTIGEGDTGPNTGGMGAYSPVPVVDKALEDEILNTIIEPTLKALHQEGIKYTGVLYAGLMLTKSGPKVVEFNCRFGDPETQVILPRLKTDLLELLLASCEGRLHLLPPPEWDPRPCVCVIAASKGYPGTPETGFPINGVDRIESWDDVYVYHAGTAFQNQQLITSGGRVLGISSLGNDMQAALDKAYQALEDLSFEGMYYRKDIGWRAL